ncbi:hypothetical protein [Buchnera aphidicola]|uniref:Flagellar motor switch protein FliM n=1 Tax=Buchnera aphidicola (Aphis nerii) TaxID=1241835 RepID=A0A4D6XNP1_9GAMM|nr:hypothetical protein [Buchnera aphidicola]QCI18643.1 hypothetical protein D9V64_00400 [Buchnera aphidicola (Aphis nerii)]
MGESNRVNIISQNSSNKKEEIYNILSSSEIKILEKINKKFIDKTIKYFADFIKSNIKLNFFTIKLNSYTDNDKYIKYLFSNEIKILDSKNQCFIFFSDNFLPVFIDLLFGGKGTYIKKISKERNITYTEEVISQKVLKIIFSAYCKSFQKVFFIDTKTINIKIIDIQKKDFLKENFITNCFNLSLNNVNIFLSILFPISIIKKNLNELISLEMNKKSFINNVDTKKNISINNLYDIELNIIMKLIMLKEVNYKSLAIGDILTIHKPDKVIGYIDKRPIFLGHYKNFNKKSIVFLEKFIHKDLDLNKHKDFFNE